VYKEATPPHGERRPVYSPGIEQLASSLFLVQVRRARWGSEDRLSNTQPFARSWRGRDWLFAHAGSLDHRLEVADERLFEPVGSTDSELLFCELLNAIADRRWRNLGDADFALITMVPPASMAASARCQRWSDLVVHAIAAAPPM
jgi:predicted glutamine amidotransferase